MHKPDTEMAVVAAMLSWPREVIPELEGVLHAQDFHGQRNAVLFDCMLRMWQGHRTPDPITVVEDLKARGKLEGAGGVDYLAALVDFLPSPANVAHYAQLVREAAVRRRLARVAEEIALDVQEQDGRPIADILDAAEARILAVSRGLVVTDYLAVTDLVDDTLRALDQAADGKVLTIPTGFMKLDHVLGGGLRAGDLSIPAGRPSMGKTAWVLNVVRHAADFCPVGVLSLEMGSGQLMARMLSAEAYVNGQSIRTGCVDIEVRARLDRAADILRALPVYVDDNPGQTVAEVRAKARRLVSAKGVRLVVVDYLQLLSGSRSTENRVQEVSEISRGLKALARELHVHVLAVSQLSRAVESRADKRPMLSDLRESGSIEQDADNVFLLFRPDYYDHAEAVRGTAELIIAKQRNGPTGSLALRFDRRYSRFEEPPLGVHYRAAS